MVAAIACVLVVCGLGRHLLAIELTVPDIKARPGSAFILPVTLIGGENCAAIDLRVRFDEGLVSLPDTRPPVPGNLIADHTIGTNWASDSVNVLVFSGSLSPLRPGPGTLVYLVLQLSSSAGVGSVISADLEGVVASDASGGSVPVVTHDGTITVANDLDMPAAGAHEVVFPQVADGTFPGGSFMSSLIFVNRTEAAITGRVSFAESDGTPMALRLMDGRTGSEFTFTVPGGGSIFMQTDGSAPLAVGYARLTASGPLGGTILFSQRDGAGRVLLEAGVGAAAAGTRFSIPLLYTSGKANTGVAFANTSGQPVELRLILRDKAGEEIDNATVRLGIGEHIPKFATELFDSFSGRSDFAGLLDVLADHPVSAVALKLQGLILTTFPVVSTIYTPPLLPRIEVTPVTLDFGTVSTGGNKPLDFTVKNVGDAELQVSSITKSSTVYAITSPALPFSVPPGGEQKVTVTFTPTAAGTVTDTLSVNSSDLAQPSVTVSLSGTGYAGTAPTIQDVTVTKLAKFTLKVDIQLTDPDGDISKLEFSWYLGTTVRITSTLNSPADVNLAGVTAGTVTYTFSNMEIPSVFGSVSADKVEVKATDSRGLVSNTFSKEF